MIKEWYSKELSNIFSTPGFNGYIKWFWATIDNSTATIGKLCGLELNNILIQQEFNFIETGSNDCAGKEKDLIVKLNYQVQTAVSSK